MGVSTELRLSGHSISQFYCCRCSWCISWKSYNLNQTNKEVKTSYKSCIPQKNDFHGPLIDNFTWRLQRLTPAKVAKFLVRGEISWTTCPKSVTTFVIIVIDFTFLDTFPTSLLSFSSYTNWYFPWRRRSESRQSCIIFLLNYDDDDKVTFLNQ